MTSPSLLAVALAAALLPAAARLDAQPARGAGDRAAVAAITAVSREFSRRYERGDAAGMVALYTPDGVAFPPARAAVRGTVALTEYWGAQTRTKVLAHEAIPDSIAVVGTAAHDWGVYRVRFVDGAGATREAGGKYLIVWRRTSAGWRMHLDMWNAGPAAAP